MADEINELINISLRDTEHIADRINHIVENILFNNLNEDNYPKLFKLLLNIFNKQLETNLDERANKLKELYKELQDKNA